MVKPSTFNNIDIGSVFQYGLEDISQNHCCPTVISKAQWVRFGKRLLLLGAVLSFAWLPRAQAATDCTAVTEIPQVECEALVALYTSTDGPNWSDSPDNDWNVTDTPCSSGSLNVGAN